MTRGSSMIFRAFEPKSNTNRKSQGKKIPSANAAIRATKIRATDGWEVLLMEVGQITVEESEEFSRRVAESQRGLVETMQTTTRIAAKNFGRWEVSVMGCP